MVKKFFKNIKAKCKGFSLMELVVTIAIMAVLAAVLAPALIHYVEDSRAAKDDHAMQEVVNAMNVALAYDDAYDEIIDDITWKNSCYVDSYSPKDEHKELLFVDDNEELYQSYKYTDEERILDETPYKFNGRMYGATVTFRPNNDHVIEIKDAVYSGEGKDKKISEMSEENVLYTKIKQVIGNKIELTSATYKNSQYTIFICFGVEAEKTQNEYKVTLSDEPIVIYGQWNGTNLLTIEMQDPSMDDKPTFNPNIHEGIIPDGAEYGDVSLFDGSCCIRCGYDFEGSECPACSGTLDESLTCQNCGQVFTKQTLWCYCSWSNLEDYEEHLNNPEAPCTNPGDAFPSNPTPGDSYKYGDYLYVYGWGWGYSPYSVIPTEDNVVLDSGYWTVFCIDETGSFDNTTYPYFNYKTEYQPWLTSIAGKPVSSEVLFYPLDSNHYVDKVVIPNGEQSLGIGQTNYLNNTNIYIRKIEFLGTKQQLAQVLKNSDEKWYNYIDLSTCENKLHCADGVVCVAHSNVTNLNKHEDVNQAYHAIFKKCNDCQLEYGCRATHSYSSANVTTYEVLSATQHKYKLICSVCNRESSNYSTGYHVHSASDCQTNVTCTICKYDYGFKGHHTPTNGQCKCGKEATQIIIDRNAYVDRLNYKIFGTWNYPNAKSVNITITYHTESTGCDWISIAQGTGYSSGSTTTKTFLTTSGTLKSTTPSNPSVKFGGTTSTIKTFSNVNMLSGTVFFKTDGSINGTKYNGATITITPN